MRLPSAIVGAVAAAVLVLAAGAGTAPAADLPEASAVAGTWGGARLLCQKEESKLVRCGTPSPFSVTFNADGTGTAPAGSLPEAFSWHWVSPEEIAVVPDGGGDEIRLFSIEIDEGMLTFQAYVYLPTADPNAPPEARYIHYIFDVNRMK